tara:strand:+ start:2874 stop:3335 length:462 start_codon:yes stop_codon:yes gene_type:complete
MAQVIKSVVRIGKGIEHNNPNWRLYCGSMSLRKEVLWDSVQKPNKPTFSNFYKMDKNALHFVALSQNDEVIGTVSLHDNLIRQVAVKPTFKNNGIATNLINELIDENIEYFTVNSLCESVDFYKKLGFVDSGVEKYISPNCGKEVLSLSYTKN